MLLLFSRYVMSDSSATPWTVARQAPWAFPGKNTGVGCDFLLQGIFPIQRLNPCPLHWQVESTPVNHQGSPTINYSSEMKVSGNPHGRKKTSIHTLFSHSWSKLLFFPLLWLVHPKGFNYSPCFKPALRYLIHYYFLFVVNFVIHWNETAMGLHVFPIPIPPPTSLSTCSL